VPESVVTARRARLAELLRLHRYLPVQEVCRRLKVSEATARRDLSALARTRLLTRTYGGALSQLASFDRSFPSFPDRQLSNPEGKREIGRQVRKILRPGQTVFFDSGTTLHFIAQHLAEKPISPLRVVTCSLPVAEVFSSSQKVEVFLLAGELLPRQSVLLGEFAQRSAQFWDYDVCLLGAEGINSAGAWNSDPAIIEFQRTISGRSRHRILCADSSKLGRNAPEKLCSWNEVDRLITDATAAQLSAAGIAPGR
jgi:DeoR/GlpR family transcriptional regulator of sugar metabolism